MNLLALETSSDLFSVALQVEEKCLKYDEFITYQSSQRVLPVIQQLLSEGNINLKDLDALVLGVGPGSFTGLRIAGSVTQAIAFACDLPVILISSLRVLAQEAFENLQAFKVLTAVNAYQDEIYWAGYELDATGLMQIIIPDSLVAPDNIQIPDSMGWTGVGNGWKICADSLKKICLEQLAEIQTEHYPTASALIKLGQNAFLHQKFVPAEKAIPVYLRGQEAWKKSGV